MSVGENEEDNQGISADEVALYDRQIRLWGMAAQERMRNAHVLIITANALANEIIKNLVLAGIGAITILDSVEVSETDLGAQFLVSEEDIGKNRAAAAAVNARKLNPRVQVNVEEAKAQDKAEEYFLPFNLVVACDLGLSEIVRVNNFCRRAKKPFYSAEIPGMSGYVFADLIEHDFVTEREETAANGERQKVSVPQKETYASLEEVLKHNYGSTLRPKLRKKVSALLPLSIAYLEWKDRQSHDDSTSSEQSFFELSQSVSDRLGLTRELVSAELADDFLNGSGCELSAIAAIVGGVLSQDVLNVLSGREVPVQNFFIFDGESGDGPIYKV